MKLSNGTEVVAQPYREEDAEEIVRLIRRNFKEVNVKDYGERAMVALSATHDVNWFKGVAEYAHVYVFWNENKIVGVGSISSFWGSLTESILLTIFVLPEFHGQGIGSYIIDTLESDELFLRAERIEIPASITAVEFYRKKGYEYKNGIKELDAEQHYRLEKFRKIRDAAMENLIVRYAKREELESVNNIRKQVNEVHVKGRPDIFREDGWQFIEPFVYTRFDEENSGVIVAVNEDEIVGFAVVQYIVRPESPYNNERRYFHIEEFGVDEKHRREGIATAMIDFIKEDAKKRGFKRIELDMWEFNDGALAFYESVGLKTYRRYMECYTDTEEEDRI